MMNICRIIYTEADNFNGNIVDRQFSTKWMTQEEAEKSEYMQRRNAKIVRRGTKS